MRAGSAVADSSTGPAKKNENGLSSPPVRYIRTASCPISKASSHAARLGSSRRACWNRMRSAIFSQADSTMTARQA